MRLKSQREKERERFKVRAANIADKEERMMFVFKSSAATEQEKAVAGGWLFTHGYNHLEDL